VDFLKITQMFGIKLSVDESNLLYLLIFKSFADNIVTIVTIMEWVKVLDVFFCLVLVTKRKKIKNTDSNDRPYYRDSAKN
jgi:hypothetical protein